MSVGWPEHFRESHHRDERVEPQRIHFDGLADARRDDVIAHFGVHPGELHAGLTGVEESVARVHVNLVARAADVPFDNVRENGEQLLKQRQIFRGCKCLPCGLEKPQRGVHRVVLRRIAAVGEGVGQHAAIGEARVGEQDRAREFGPARCQRQPGKRDHRVAPPIAEPVIAGDY